jgi:monofunctional biosynthetic peptidoglycan transglycosylase
VIPRSPLRAAVFALSVAALLVVAWEALTWPDVAALSSARPGTTAFIRRESERRAKAGEPAVEWIWVPDERISVHLRRAVVAGEDMEFFAHEGFSRTELRAALHDAVVEGKKLRGASTITQQLAKNLWLSPSRNPLRKVREALLTRSLERHLSKRRILEIYMNVAELGPGVFGAEAASRRYFGKSAAELDEHEAAELAAGLPRPEVWHPGVSSSGYRRYTDDIRRRMDKASFLWGYVRD